MGNNLCSNYFYTLVPGEQAGRVAGDGGGGGGKPRQRRKKSGAGGRRETVEDEGARIAARPLGQEETEVRVRSPAPPTSPQPGAPSARTFLPNAPVWMDLCPSDAKCFVLEPVSVELQQHFILLRREILT